MPMAAIPHRPPTPQPISRASALRRGALRIAVLTTKAVIGVCPRAGSASVVQMKGIAGRIEIAPALGNLIAPALIGNVIGGTGLFALLAHAQVRQEL
jgi:hypothetical protein